MQFFEKDQEHGHVRAIRSLSGELMYLIEGSKKALLVDTSVGVYGLRAFVDAMTDKPYDLVLTHGHIDHALGAPEFMDKNIYMSHKDIDVYHSMQDVEERMMYVKFCGGISVRISPDDLIPPTEVDFIDLKDGQIFDLGDLHVEMIPVPGHTQGSFALLIQEDRSIILGDAANNFTFLFDELYSSSVAEYKEMLLALTKRIEGRVDHIFLCHHKMEISMELLPELLEVCDEILNGSSDDVPFEFMGKKENAVIAKKMEWVEKGPTRLDGKIANIVFNSVKR